MKTRTVMAVGIIAVGIIAVASCGSHTSAVTRRSGITGTVVAGPTCPVETPESPCPDRPVADAVVTAKGNGTTRTTRSDTSGAFRLRLPRGNYVVTASSDDTFGCDEQRARVVKGRFTDVLVTCDTGIR